MTLEEIGKAAKQAEPVVRNLSAERKNRILCRAAECLRKDTEKILDANRLDMENGRNKGMTDGLLDRLLLTEERVEAMAGGLEQLASLEDPIGGVEKMRKRPNGLIIGQKRVPLGVVGMIYEARPNVTTDAFGLCLKTGNVVILKGGSDAVHSNRAIAEALQKGLEAEEIPTAALSLIEDTSRETAQAFMKMNRYLDVLIPRGGAGLIRAVVENSTVPVIETGTGNCHIYIDETADKDMAVSIVLNAKTQRVGVCNACESVVVHEKAAGRILPELAAELEKKKVEIRADEYARSFMKEAVPASEEDWGTEYLDFIVSVKTVSGIGEAIEHINRYNTGHSEAIITESYASAQRFLDEIDAAAVYVNASTRFTDGFEFGYGAEIGISTQKLHARGPMGLDALTTTKYIIYGNGQIRE